MRAIIHALPEPNKHGRFPRRFPGGTLSCHRGGYDEVQDLKKTKNTTSKVFFLSFRHASVADVYDIVATVVLLGLSLLFYIVIIIIIIIIIRIIAIIIIIIRIIIIIIGVVIHIYAYPHYSGST